MRAVADEVFNLTVATSPSIVGATVELVSVHGIDGVDIGYDASGDPIVYPVSMAEGLDGVYSAEVLVSEPGPYWARLTVDGVALEPTIVRVESAGFPADDATSGTPYTITLVAPDAPASVDVTVTDSAGVSAGTDDQGVAIVWPRSMAQVPGYMDEWYFEDVTFSEGGRYQFAFSPSAGPIRNSAISVYETPTVPTLAHSAGWSPTAALVPSDWVSLSYIRRWTGWTTAAVSDEDLREIRRTAIHTWIEETGMWVPAWHGTFNQLRGQGSTLYLPVPVVLPSAGGQEPVVRYVEPWGDQDEVDSIDVTDLVWHVAGSRAKQPFVELSFGSWDPGLDVVITASWGVAGIDGTPIPVKQAIVGLARWHALSFGVDGDEARDQAVAHRVTSEGTRDSRADYHQSAIGLGVTGNPVVDKIIARYRIDPGPWIRRRGDAGAF